MRADATIEGILRTLLRSRHGAFYRAGSGLDDVGLIADVCATAQREHRGLIDQSVDRMLRNTAMALLREMDHGSRGAPIMVPTTTPSQPMLPAFAEIEQEYYTDSENRRWRLVDMSLTRLRNVILYYQKQERAYAQRVLHLQRFVVAMEERQLGPLAKVRELYG